MERTAKIERGTKETSIKIELNLDGAGKYNINTGIGFFDHMLEQLAKHSMIDLKIEASGDLHIDCHHLIEDTAIALGQAVNEALGEKRGIVRVGVSYVPMDEALTRATIDLCGRSYPLWNVKFTREQIGGVDSEMFREWFFAFAINAKCNLHIENLYGLNNHHIIESCFKALARALAAAIAIDPRKLGDIPSTKGSL